MSVTFDSNALVNGLPDVNAVTVTIDGTIFDGWETLHINRTLEAIAGEFEIELTDKWRTQNKNWPIVPGTRVNIKIGTESIITGFIDVLDVGISNETRRFVVRGRDVTGDLVDSSAYRDPSEFKNITLTKLTKMFATDIFGIPVIEQVSAGAPFVRWTIEQGESVFEMLVRAAKLRGLLLISSGDGKLIITTSGRSQPTVSSLIQGENVLTASASYDWTDRFQTYLIKGQAVGSDTVNGKAATQVYGIAYDNGVNRSRTLIKIAEDAIDGATAKDRAQWEAVRRAADSVRVRVTVKGWTETTGALWEINKTVRVEIGFIGLPVTQMLITGVEFIKDVNVGTITNLMLTRSDAYQTDAELTASKDPSATLGWLGKSYGDLVNMIKGT